MLRLLLAYTGWRVWRSRRRKASARNRAARAASDEALADLMLEHVYSQLGFQLGSSDSLDVKSVTLLTADIAAISILIIVHKIVGVFWFVPAGLMFVAGLFFLYAIRTRDWDIGEEFEAFRKKYAGRTPTALKEAMFVELEYGLQKNQPIIGEKKKQLRWGYRFLAAAVVLAVCLAIARGPGFP